MHLFLFLVFLRVSSRKLPNFFRIIPFPFFPTRGAFTTSSVFPTEHVQQLITLLLPNFFYHNEKHRCPIWSYCLVNNISEGFPKWASIGSRIYIFPVRNPPSRCSTLHGLWQKLEELELVKPWQLVSTPSQLPRDPHLSFVDSGIGRFIHSPQCVSAVLWNSGWLTPMFLQCPHVCGRDLDHTHYYQHGRSLNFKQTPPGKRWISTKINCWFDNHFWASWSPSIFEKIKEMEVTAFRNENKRCDLKYI